MLNERSASIVVDQSLKSYPLLLELYNYAKPREASLGKNPSSGHDGIVCLKDTSAYDHEQPRCFAERDNKIDQRLTGC